MDAFALAFAVVFLAELGDKSQLTTLAFASRYGAWTVLLAVTIATLVITGLSVLLGSVLALAVPTSLIQVLAGIAFLGFAGWTLRGDGDDDEDDAGPARTGRWALLTIGATFFLAELGDKTMLATITLASTGEPLGTWLGATAGMVVADSIAIALGALLGTRLPKRAVRIAAAAAFVVFGVVLIVEGVS